MPDTLSDGRAQRAFMNNLKILHSLDQCEVGQDIMRGQWDKFCDDPVRFLMRCDDETADAIWVAMEKRQPKRSATS